MGILSNLFGGNKKQQVEDFKQRGALIIDVRNPGEFASRHFEGSQNIPLPQVKNEVQRLKKLNKPIIVCCASGVRSGNAKIQLEKAGIEVVNAGGWRAL